MTTSRRAVLASVGAIALAPTATAAREPAQLVGRIYRQSDLALSAFRDVMYTRWHLDEDVEGLLIRHCETGLTYRVVESGYPLAVQELRVGRCWQASTDPIQAFRIGCAARFVAGCRYWTYTFRRARHRGAVYYTISSDGGRVMEGA